MNEITETYWYDIITYKNNEIITKRTMFQPDNIPDIPNRPWNDEEPDEDKK